MGWDLPSPGDAEADIASPIWKAILNTPMIFMNRAVVTMGLFLLILRPVRQRIIGIVLVVCYRFSTRVYLLLRLLSWRSRLFTNKLDFESSILIRGSSAFCWHGSELATQLWLQAWSLHNQRSQMPALPHPFCHKESADIPSNSSVDNRSTAEGMGSTAKPHAKDPPYWIRSLYRPNPACRL